MKKNGFTLVEILVSVSLISVVLVTMLNTLVRLKDVYSKSNDDTEVRVYGAIISRTINKDVINHGGLKTITCSSNITTNIHTCNIVLNDNSNRSLTLRIKTTETNDTSIPPKWKKVKNRSTVEYKNSTTNARLLIKTIYSDEVYTTTEDGYMTDTKYYYFIGLTNNTKVIGTKKINIISLKASKSEYDVNIYSN